MARVTPAYLESLHERLGMINDLGANQTTWQRIEKQRQDEAKARNESLQWQQAQLDAAKRGATNAAGIAGNIQQSAVSGLKGMVGNIAGAASSGAQRFIDQIGQKESGGNYGAVNKSSGALGKYQVMPANIRGKGRGWDYEALGRDISTQQYLNSPQLQEQIATYKLRQYYNKYGPAGASIAWYAGPGAAKKYVNSGYASSAKQGNYPSISSYMNAIMKGLV